MVTGKEEQWVWVTWALLRNEFPIFVEGMYIVLLVWS